LLRYVREDRGVEIPKLMLLEAQALRQLADRQVAYDVAVDNAMRAVRILQRAEDIVTRRRPTQARNAELFNILTTRAAVHGYVIGAHLKRVNERDAPGGPTPADIWRKISDELDAVDLYVGRTRGLGRASFYPLDVDFWVQKDIFNQMPGLSDTQRTHFLSKMAMILDLAVEEPLETSQLERYRRRRINLAELEGKLEISEELAERMRRDGDLGGWCQILRHRVYDPQTRVPRSPEEALRGLTDLLGLGDLVWREREALPLANRLWMAVNVPGGQIAGADPLRVACSAQEWDLWRRILVARRGFPEDRDNTFI
nr:hypothetical protein [Micromonospora sp. DSM 115978]